MLSFLGGAILLRSTKWFLEDLWFVIFCNFAMMATRLEILQERSRERHAGVKALAAMVSTYQDWRLVMEGAESRITTTVKKKPVVLKLVKPKPNSRVDFEKVKKFAQPATTGRGYIDDYSGRSFERPPAVYSNTSPFGIASELHNSKTA